MYNVPVPRFPSHWRKSRARNSGPLSDRICSGIPRHSITSDTTLPLARYFGTTPQAWLNLQQTYELWRAAIAVGHWIAECVQPRHTAA